MSSYKESFLQYLDKNNKKYDDSDEYEVIVWFSTDNIDIQDISVSFDKNGKGLVQLCAWTIARFSEDKYVKGVLACNELNAKYRWVKFFIDSDNDVCASVDAYVDQETAGEECYKLLSRMVCITDEAYPVLMKALWS